MALLKRLLSIVQNDPSAVAVLLSAVLALGVSRYKLTAAEVAGIDGAGVAVLGLLAAAFTRPFHVQALSGFIAALGTLLTAFAAHLQPGVVGAASAVLAALLLLTREHKTTTVAAINRATSVRMARVSVGEAGERLRT